MYPRVGQLVDGYASRLHVMVMGVVAVEVN